MPALLAELRAVQFVARTESVIQCEWCEPKNKCLSSIPTYFCARGNAKCPLDELSNSVSDGGGVLVVSVVLGKSWVTLQKNQIIPGG